MDLKQARVQLSLNTCQGCHSGETKTFFTHVRPVAYGESTNYWGTIPDHQTGAIDTRFAENNGITELGGSSTYDNYTKPITNGHLRYVVNVSAFLTGRNYSGEEFAGTYNDDYVDGTEDGTDNGTEGLFYVYDPTNRGSGLDTYPAPQPPRWGYNDLERRKQDLCRLINRDCNPTLLAAPLSIEINKGTFHE